MQNLEKSRDAIHVPPEARVVGFDLLRGLAALSVAVFHLTAWIFSVYYYNLGQSSVHVFFVLSGASMVLGYWERFQAGLRIHRFLLLRFFRLAPLYWPIVAASLVYHTLQPGASVLDLCSRAILNLTFTFGFANPGVSSLATGAWSLGIECIFYALFPAFVCFLSHEKGSLWLALGCLTVQVLFVNNQLQHPGDLIANWGAYCQFAAYVGYFFGGCYLGRLLRQDRARIHAWPPGLVWMTFLTLIAFQVIVFASRTEEEALVGLRGLVLTMNNLLLVFFAYYLRVPGRLGRLSIGLGAASYGLYLLHPQIFKLFHHWPEVRAYPVLELLVILGCSGFLSLLLEAFWERPVRRFAQERFLPRKKGGV